MLPILFAAILAGTGPGNMRSADQYDGMDPQLAAKILVASISDQITIADYEPSLPEGMDEVALYTRPMYSGPETCKSKVISFVFYHSPRLASVNDVYAYVPVKEQQGYDGSRRATQKACDQIRTGRNFFSSPNDEDAHTGGHLLHLIVRAMRRAEPLPFKLITVGLDPAQARALFSNEFTGQPKSIRVSTPSVFDFDYGVISSQEYTVQTEGNEVPTLVRIDAHCCVYY